MEIERSETPYKLYQQLISSSANLTVKILPLTNPVYNVDKDNSSLKPKDTKNKDNLTKLNCNICGSTENKVCEDEVPKVTKENVNLLEYMLEFEINFNKFCLTCTSTLIQLVKMKRELNVMMRRIDSVIKCIKYVRKMKEKNGEFFL